MGIRQLARTLLGHLRGRQLLRAVVFRTGAIRWWWRYRHLIDGSYREPPPAGTTADPHREQLWSLISPIAAESLIEVGCGDGANLALFARRAPRMRLSAVDLNPLALGIAEQRVRALGGNAGTFHHASADHLPVPSASADVALSDAVFMYLPPASAVAAIHEMRRVARRALVVHSFADDSLTESAVLNGNWVHAFAKIAAAAIPGARVERHPSRLESGRWGLYGAIYVVSW